MPQNPWEIDWSKQVPEGKKPWEGNWGEQAPSFENVVSGHSTQPPSFLGTMKNMMFQDLKQKLDFMLGMPKGVGETVQTLEQWKSDVPRQISDIVTGKQNPFSTTNAQAGTPSYLHPGLQTSTGADLFAANNPDQQMGKIGGQVALGIATGGATTGAGLPAQVAAGGLAGGVMAPEHPYIGSGLGMGAPIAGRAIPAAINYFRNFGDTGPSNELFNKAMAVAKDQPIDTWNVGNEVIRAEQLKSTGSTLPKVFSDYLRHQGPMDYATGRDFAIQAGRMSSAETQAANPVMQRQVARFAKAMSEATQEAATKAGVGQIHSQAMSGYARAMSQRELAEAFKEFLKNRGAQAALGTGAAYGAYRALTK